VPPLSQILDPPLLQYLSLTAGETICCVKIGVLTGDVPLCMVEVSNNGHSNVYLDSISSHFNVLNMPISTTSPIDAKTHV
jgi:hypothetical protein